MLQNDELQKAISKLSSWDLKQFIILALVITWWNCFHFIEIQNARKTFLFFAGRNPLAKTLKKIKCHTVKGKFRIFPTRNSQPFRAWIFNASRNKICYYTFHLSQFAKQIMFPTFHRPLPDVSRSPSPLVDIAESTWWKHKENCKKNSNS